MQLTHILVADDNAVIRKLLERLFRQAGYQVELAINGEELIQKALAQRPGVVKTRNQLLGAGVGVAFRNLVSSAVRRIRRSNPRRGRERRSLRPKRHI